LLLLGYLAFIPTGPYPIYIVSGLRLDVIFGLLLLSFCFVYLGKIGKYPDILVLAWLFYFFIVFLSAILSVDIELSARNSFVIFGYSVITLVVPVVFVSRANVIRRWLFLTSVLVSIYIIYIYTTHGFAHDHRFSLSAGDLSFASAKEAGLAAVDPNMTAAGIILGLIVYFPNLFDNCRRLFWDSLGSICILLASVITLSRSAVLGFVLSISFSFLIVSVATLNWKDPLILNRKILVSLSVFLVTIPGVIFLGYIIFPEIIDKLTERIASSADDSFRISLLVNSLDVFMTDIKTIVIGSGFMTTNPHNEYMRTLSTMWLLGLMGSIFFFGYMFYLAITYLSRSNRMMFSALSIIVFMMTVSLFYGYTKLIWVAWMFLLLLYREALVGFHVSAVRVT